MQTASEPIDELIYLATSSRTRNQFRSAAVRWLDATVGFDFGYFGKVPDPAADPAPMLHNCSSRQVQQYRAESARYLPDTLDLIHRAHQRGGVGRDEELLAGREGHCVLNEEILRPQGVHEMVTACGTVAGRPTSYFHIARGSRGARFGARELAIIGRAAPVFALGDALTRDDERQSIAPDIKLTARERQVIEYLVAGLTNREIAALLGTSHHTVRNQLAAVFAKLGASTRAELVGLVIREHLVDA